MLLGIGDWILKSGVEGLLGRIAKSPAGSDPEKKNFLEGMKVCLEAFLEWNDRHVAALEEKLTRASGDTSELRKMIRICRKVPRHGAASFREALQAFHFSYLATLYENPYGGNSPGRSTITCAVSGEGSGEGDRDSTVG